MDSNIAQSPPPPITPWTMRTRRLLRRAVPVLYDRLYPAWANWRLQRRAKRLPHILARFEERYGLIVQGGPFKGMRYIDEATNSGHLPKLVGCYEDEILPAIEWALGKNYDSIVDVGSAEGYYAVGFAFVNRRTRVFAFDIEEHSQKLCAKLAELNGVADRVAIGGWCDHSALNSILATGNAFILSDCEGGELPLLDPTFVPALSRCDMLVELHDAVDPTITPTILKRFGGTHAVTIINSVRRNPRGYPVVQFLPRKLRALAVDDLRGSPQQWVWLKSRPSNI